jgi:LysR family glycine cleavage system transcriptional activator
VLLPFPGAPLPPLNWLRAFEAAARHMSFTNAGRELGVTQSAVSQNVRLLEGHLGQPLFRRLPQRLELTDSGKAYLPVVHEGFQVIGAGTREVFGPGRGERITVRTTPGFADLWLGPRLGELYAMHPDLNLRVLSTIWEVEFEGGGDILEIRYGDGDWPGTESARLTHDRVFPVASPAVAARLASDPRLLSEMRLLHTVGFRVSWPQWLEAAGLSEDVDGTGGDQFDTALLPSHLAEQGHGVALVRLSLVADMLSSGRLVAPLRPAIPTEEAFHLVWPGATPMSADARRFADWLIAAAARFADEADAVVPGTAAAPSPSRRGDRTERPDMR